MMVKSIKLLPKKEMVLYIIFALLYSCQGIVIPIIIQMAGHLDSGNSRDLIVFTLNALIIERSRIFSIYIKAYTATQREIPEISIVDTINKLK